MARRCTVPALFGGVVRDLYERIFNAACDRHDTAYENRKGGEIGRLKADFNMFFDMLIIILKLLRDAAFALLTFPFAIIFTLSLGWLWWYDVPQKFGFKKL